MPAHVDKTGLRNRLDDPRMSGGQYALPVPAELSTYDPDDVCFWHGRPDCEPCEGERGDGSR
jgi:hypothetical protein